MAFSAARLQPAADLEKNFQAESTTEEEVPQQADPQQAETIQVPTLTMVLGVKINHTHATKHPDTLTYPQYSHVSGTGPMGSLHIFAWSRAPAPGRTSGPPKPTIEGPASPTRRQLRQ